MKKFILFSSICSLILVVSAVFAEQEVEKPQLRFVPSELLFNKAQPSSKIDLPSGELVAQWMNFSRPLKLEVEMMVGSEGRGDYRKWGKLIQFNYYQAAQDSLVSYGIGVYEKGTLWAEHQQEMIQGVEKAVQEGLRQPPPFDEEWKKMYRIDQRPDGQKEYYMVLGMGPGGGVLGGFTFLPEYDLLVTEMDDAQDDIPIENKMQNPAKPQNDLSVLMSKVVEYLYAKK